MKTLGQFNKDEETYERIQKHLVEHFIRQAKFDKLGQFIQMCKDTSFLRDQSFQRTVQQHCFDANATPEAALKMLNYLTDTGFPINVNLLVKSFLPKIIGADDLQLVRITDELKNVVNVRHSILCSALIQYMLNKDHPRAFQEVAFFCYMKKSIWSRTQAVYWKNSLARNYLMHKDLDTLVTILMFSSSMWHEITESGLKNQGEWVENHDVSLFNSLISVHQEAHRFSRHGPCPAYTCETCLEILISNYKSADTCEFEFFMEYF